ncbi:MAG: hypothetical protein K2Y30_02080 [Flavobacteriaceae bacterium]|nr:hypothetical protein [Flavobacteriaceae bacterium]
MANSTIIITFNSLPIDGQVINISDTSTSTLLNEIFKGSRTAFGQVTIPAAAMKRYRLEYPTDAPIQNIGVRYKNSSGNIVQAEIGSFFSLNDGFSGTDIIELSSFIFPVIINMSNGSEIIWSYGSFFEISSSSVLSIVDNYKIAFDTDYNNSNLFSVQAINDSSGNSLGTIIITANYTNAFFILNSNTTNVTVTINNQNSVPTFSFVPANLLFAFNQNETLPSNSVFLTGNNWKVIGKVNFVLSSTTVDVVIDTITSSDGVYQTISGSGNGEVKITLGAYYNQDIVFQPSDLSGSFMVMKDNVFFGNVAFLVTISTISDFLTNPYNGQRAFTLDPKYFEFRSINIDTYFQFDATIKTYDFFTNAVQEYFIPLKIVLFNQYAKENLGQIIHRLMNRFDSVNDNIYQYKQAILQINCTEISLSDESIIRSGTTKQIPFIAGLGRGITDVGFLDFNPKENRVTVQGFAFLNMIVPGDNYQLRTFKNGTLVNSYALPSAADFVICKKVYFSEYAQGDVIDFEIDLIGQTSLSAPRKKYIMFPDDNHSNMIVWENEFLVQSAIECTGTASLVPEGEFQSQTIYVDLVEQLEHLSSSKEVKLYINTGFLMFSDIDTVESLMRSKRAWLIQGNNTISLRPIRKQLPKTDLQEELIQYPLEFKINQKYDEETYSL